MDRVDNPREQEARKVALQSWLDDYDQRAPRILQAIEHFDMQEPFGGPHPHLGLSAMGHLRRGMRSALETNNLTEAEEAQQILVSMEALSTGEGAKPADVADAVTNLIHARFREFQGVSAEQHPNKPTGFIERQALKKLGEYRDSEVSGQEIDKGRIMATAIRLADEVRQRGGGSSDFDVFDGRRVRPSAG